MDMDINPGTAPEIINARIANIAQCLEKIGSIRVNKPFSSSESRGHGLPNETLPTIQREAA
jgi:hypothetical protein